VHGGDPARARDPDALAGGLDHLVLCRANVEVAEVPRALLAQHSGRLAALVAHDDAARDLEVAIRLSEGGRVEPERVVVTGHERRRRVARDPVEHVLRRLDGRRPVAAPPSRPAQPVTGLHVVCGRRDAVERLVERAGAFQPDLALRERPRREVNVGVVEPRQHAPAADVDALGTDKRRLVGPDPAGDPLAGDRQRMRDGERRLHRPDDPVLENHARDCSGHRGGGTSRPRAAFRTT
jgi:hypothetical protein